MKDFSELEKKLNLKFKNRDLLVQAFVHRSYLNEHPDFEIGHNERLEFLGDAVIELIVTEYLFKKYPSKPEGDLTNWRAALVNAHQLAAVGEELGLGKFLLLSKGETKDIDKARRFILANNFEAFVGAIYLDLGYEVYEKFIEKYLIKELPHIIKDGLYKDPKSLFQEEAQDKIGITPVYKVLEEWGPDHAKHYVDMGIARYINKEEALSILEKAQEAGLVLQPETSLRPEAICCCCGDCCALLTSIKHHPRPADLYVSNYYAEVDPELCTGCETCIQQCQLEAVVLADDVARVNLDRCIGCGNCVATCPSNAARLKKKEKEWVPPANKEAFNMKLLSLKVGRWNTFKIRMKMLLGLKV